VDRSSQAPPQPTPVTEDAQATVPQLLARAHADYSNAQAATDERQAQGGIGERHGILPGSTR
jgi:hypothetical protein